VKLAFFNYCVALFELHVMPNRSLGFTLIEVLISMILLAIGLLGLASLQAIALRDNQDAYYYQQATLLAYEMQDRIRANVNFTDWTTVIPQQGNNCNAPQNPCTPQQLAAYDYWYWQTKATKVLPISQTNLQNLLKSNPVKTSIKAIALAPTKHRSA
jgi:type IV pilus assembly protein PilV